jgi:hypothetical protein
MTIYERLHLWLAPKVHKSAARRVHLIYFHPPADLSAPQRSCLPRNAPASSSLTGVSHLGLCLLFRFVAQSFRLIATKLGARRFPI